MLKTEYSKINRNPVFTFFNIPIHVTSYYSGECIYKQDMCAPAAFHWANPTHSLTLETMFYVEKRGKDRYLGMMCNVCVPKL